MAEPERQESAEVQLFARLKLQRVVFGAFAVVMVSLFALGLSVYRRMQQDKSEAQESATEAQRGTERASSDRQILERELQDTRDDLAESTRNLALAHCRLAMHEIRAGNLTRARALLDQAAELGPPAWWPLVAHLTRDEAVRFEGSEHASDPIIAGAVSADLTAVLVARLCAKGVIVERYSGGGKMILASPAMEAGPPPQAGARMLISRDGSAWYLSLAGQRWYGAGGATFNVEAGPTADWPGAAMAIAGNDDLSTIYEAHGDRGLVLRQRGESGNWASSLVPMDLDQPAVYAVCIVGDKPVIATSRGIYVVGDGGRTGLLYALEQPADRYALTWGPGVLQAALLRGRELELAMIKPGENPVTGRVLHTIPDEPVEDLRFMSSGSAVWIGRAGRAGSADFVTRQDWALGDYALSFTDGHSRGTVFANRKGELSVRVRDSGSAGRSIALVPPRIEARPAAHGFVLHVPSGERIVLQRGRARALGSVVSVALAPSGPAFVSENLVLPDGTRSDEQGVVLGAFHDGSVLMFSAPGRLKRVGPSGGTEFLLGNERAPEGTVVAAGAAIAAFRLGDTVYLADMRGDPLAVASRIELAPDLLALDARGERLAIAYGPSIVVRGLRDGREYTVIAATPPRQIALLFGGTVLVTIEAGQMLFYETETGRELWRAGTAVLDMAAASDSSLNVVANGRMLELSLQ